MEGEEAKAEGEEAKEESEGEGEEAWKVSLVHVPLIHQWRQRRMLRIFPILRILRILRILNIGARTLNKSVATTAYIAVVSKKIEHECMTGISDMLTCHMRRRIHVI